MGNVPCRGGKMPSPKCLSKTVVPTCKDLDQRSDEEEDKREEEQEVVARHDYRWQHQEQAGQYL